MKLSKYISALDQLREKHGDLTLILSSKDDEGNGFNKVNFMPTLCYVLKSCKDDHIIEDVIVGPGSEQSREDFLEEHDITEAELKNHYAIGVLL